MKRFLTVLIGCVMLSLSAFAVTPFQLSLPGENLPQDRFVEGVRFTLLYGETDYVKGLDIPIGISEMNTFTGVTAAPFFLGGNKITSEFNGVALGLLNWHEGQDTGLNWGGLNLVNDVNGANIGFVNISTGHSLVSVGALNYAESASFQLGFVNLTKNLDGVQIGFVNYAENGIFPILPLINFRKGLY